MGQFLRNRPIPNILNVRPLSERDSSWKTLVFVSTVSPRDFHITPAEMYGDRTVRDPNAPTRH